jgi:hypothetical protein
MRISIAGSSRTAEVARKNHERSAANHDFEFRDQLRDSASSGPGNLSESFAIIDTLTQPVCQNCEVF